MSAYALPGAFSFGLSSHSKPQDLSLHKKITNAPIEKFRSGDTLVTITSAEINPYLLVQSLTRRKSHKTEESWNSFECKYDDDEQWGEYCETENTGQDIRIEANLHGNHNESQERDCTESPSQKRPEKTSTPPENDPQMDSIELTLSISCRGRSYTAKRTFRRLVQLRDELLNEANRRCSKVEVPELPSFRENQSSNDLHLAAMNSFSGHGFTNLHAMMCSYSPRIEEWLQMIVNLYPHSHCVANFLKRPNSGGSNRKLNTRRSKQEVKSAFSNKKKMMTLDSINEE